MAAIFIYRSARKTQTWYRTLSSSFLSSFVEFRSAVSEKSKMSQPIKGWDGHLVFPISPKNTNLVEDVEILLPVKCLWIPFSGFREEVQNVQPIRGQGGHLIFPIGQKNTNLIEDIEFFFPVKFCWIPFSGFREEVENVSVYQRLGRPSCFSDQPEKHELGRGLWDLASCQVSLNSVQQFHQTSRKCLSQSEARAAILFFSISPKNTNLVEDIEILLPVKFVEFHSAISEKKLKMYQPIRGQDGHLFFWPAIKKHKHGRGRWDLASCQVSLNSVHWFQRRSRKCLSQSEVGAAILFFRSARKTQTW